MEQLILEKIEELRLHLDKLVLEHGDLTHENVIAISQQLDRYIVFYQVL